MLELTNVSHVYSNGVRALDNVTLTIPKGMFGLLGPNGAGKSTLMRTVATLQTPSEGQISFDGLDVLAEPEELRKRLGYLPQGGCPKPSWLFAVLPLDATFPNPERDRPWSQREANEAQVVKRAENVLPTLPAAMWSLLVDSTKQRLLVGVSGQAVDV